MNFKFIPSPKKFENKEKIILRDFLAMERTSLANERTLFSYIRASLYMGIGGVAIVEYEGFASFSWLAYTVFGLSGLLIFIGIFRYRRLKKKLSTYYSSMNIDPDQKSNKTD
jgi:putative membrane protein